MESFWCCSSQSCHVLHYFIHHLFTRRHSQRTFYFRFTNKQTATHSCWQKTPKVFFNSAENFTQSISLWFPLKWSWQPCCVIIFFARWMRRQQNGHVHMKRAGEGRSASLGSSLRSSFKPLSQAEWLTLGTRLALLTRLHTDHCCCPEQSTDELLRLWWTILQVVETPKVIWNSKLQR